MNRIEYRLLKVSDIYATSRSDYKSDLNSVNGLIGLLISYAIVNIFSNVGTFSGLNPFLHKIWHLRYA